MQTLQTKLIANYSQLNTKEKILFLLNNPTTLYNNGILASEIEKLGNKLHEIRGLKHGDAIADSFYQDTRHLVESVENQIIKNKKNKEREEALRVINQQLTEQSESQPKVRPVVTNSEGTAINLDLKGLPFEPDWLQKKVAWLMKWGKIVIFSSAIGTISYVAYSENKRSTAHEKLIKILNENNLNSTPVKDEKDAFNKNLISYIQLSIAIDEIEKLAMQNKPVSELNSLFFFNSLYDYGVTLKSYITFNQKKPLTLNQTKAEIEKVLEFLSKNKNTLTGPNDLHERTLENCRGFLYYSYVHIEILNAGHLTPTGKLYFLEFEKVLTNRLKEHRLSYDKDKLKQIKELLDNLE